MLSQDVKDLFNYVSPISSSIIDLNNHLDDIPNTNLRSRRDESLTIIQDL